MLLQAGLLADLRVDDHGSEVIAFRAAFDDRTGQTVDVLAARGGDLHRDVVDAAAAAQQREVLLLDEPCRLAAAEVLRTKLADPVARVAEAVEPSIARIEEVTVRVKRDHERGALAEQPLITVSE